MQRSSIRPRVEELNAFRFADAVSTKQRVTVSCEIAAPIWRVYLNWKRLERFPSFVPAVKEARWLERKRLYWREAHEGKQFESTFAIKTNLRENSLSWQSLSGPESSGSAQCEPLPDGGSRLTLWIEFVADAESQSPGAVRSRHEAFVSAFKEFVENAPAQARI